MCLSCFYFCVVRAQGAVQKMGCGASLKRARRLFSAQQVDEQGISGTHQVIRAPLPQLARYTFDNLPLQVGTH